MYNPTPESPDSPLPTVAAAITICDDANIAMSDNLEPRLEEEEKKVASSLCLGAQEFPCNNFDERFDVGTALFGHMKVQYSERPTDESAATLEDEAVEALNLLERGKLAPLEGNHVCSTCNRRFRSYHALGGHRAAHKNVKGCFHKSSEKKKNLKDSSSRKKFKMKREEPLQEKDREGVAKRLAIEFDNKCTRVVKIFSSEQNSSHSGVLKFTYKKEVHRRPFDLNLYPNDDVTDQDPSCGLDDKLP